MSRRTRSIPERRGCRRAGNARESEVCSARHLLHSPPTRRAARRPALSLRALAFISYTLYSIPTCSCAALRVVRLKRLSDTVVKEDPMETTGPAAKPRIQFSHLGITCFDVAKMEDFYTRLIGFTVTDRGELPGISIVFMSLDPNEHHQLVLISGRTEGSGSTGIPFGGGRGSAINQISLRLASLDELRRMDRRLRAEGYDKMAPIDHGIAWSVYVRDPENNAIELFVDSDWYIVQPCAETLDLSLPDEEIRQRTEKFCRAQPGFEPYQNWKDRMAAKMAASNAQAFRD